jgi:uncharacterized GH25 family protein
MKPLPENHNMKRSLLLTAVTLIISLFSFSQEKSVYPPKPVVKSESTVVGSLKPADAAPATFGSKEELEKAVPMKIAKIKETINSGKLDDVQLQKYREELWRFENAVVVKK